MTAACPSGCGSRQTFTGNSSQIVQITKVFLQTVATGDMSLARLQINDIAVLLVEPSATQQKIIRRQLQDVGVSKLILHDNGSAALQDMQSSPPDVVISALYLPDMTGTELVHQMRNNAATESIGFILISSETRFRYLDPIRQAGVIAILPKPFDSQELRVAMHNTLNFIEPSGLDSSSFTPEELQVLIVDDSAMARKHVRRVLQTLGIEQFSEAEDGQQAVSMLADNYYDLVVTDYNMPNMDGRELVDHIRNASSQASIPVLMVTSEANDNRLAAVQQAGVSAICDKPFGVDTVRSLVQQFFC